MFAMDQLMGMNALFNNTNYITSDLPLRTGRNSYSDCAVVLLLLPVCFFAKFFSEAFLFTLLYFVILDPKVVS